jgi:hypothetical protein
MMGKDKEGTATNLKGKMARFLLVNVRNLN